MRNKDRKNKMESMRTAGSISPRDQEWLTMMKNINHLDDGEIKRLNRILCNRLCQCGQIDNMSRAVALYLRNGIIEDFHADGKLSEENMKSFNKEMTNKLAGLFKLVCDGDWIRLMLFYSYHSIQILDWDKPEPYMVEIDALYDELTHQYTDR